MDRSTPVRLISQSYTTDELLQRVPVETSRTVYANIRSVTRREWTDAGLKGYNPAFEMTMFAWDYQGEPIVEMDLPDGSTERFSVYRTYMGRNDELELYLERKAGTR